jgi:hypothetical protein
MLLMSSCRSLLFLSLTSFSILYITQLHLSIPFNSHITQSLIDPIINKMAPKKSTTGRTKKAAGMAQVSSLTCVHEQANIQPTLAFSQRKPGVEGKSKSISSTSIPRQLSNSSIDLTEDEPPKAAKEVVGIKDERRPLNPKSKEWTTLYGDAKAAMGGMEPSKLTPTSCDLADK